MFDPYEVTIDGVQLIVVVFGIVEFLKSLLNLDGWKVTLLATLTGAILYALFEVATLFPDPYALIYAIAIRTIVFGLTASGLYKFTASRFPKAKAEG